MSDLEQMIRAIVRDELAKQVKPANEETEHLTVAEYARRWSLGQSTVRAAIAERRLEHTRIGRAVRIPAGAKIAAAPTSANELAVLKLMRGGRTR